MTNAPDLMALLALDPRFSQSPFGGNHRSILIEKDYENSGDFVFNSLLQHFGRREPNTQILLITLSHDWSSYSATAAKCGFNLRKKQNMGNIDVMNMMEKYLEDLSNSLTSNYCDLILDRAKQFIADQRNSTPSDQATVIKPLVVMIDDLSLLITLGCHESDIIKMIMNIDQTLRAASKNLPPGRLTHLVVQTMFTNIKAKQAHLPEDKHLNFLISNLENLSDLYVTLKPLETGHSTRVDGTIKMIDNRLTAKQSVPSGDKNNILSSMLFGSSADIGTKKAYFYKLSDRRVRLTSSALIF